MPRGTSRRDHAHRLLALFPGWVRVQYGDGLVAHLRDRPRSLTRRLRALRWAFFSRFADADTRARGASSFALGEQIRMHARRLSRAAALAAAGGIAVYGMVDDSPLAKVVNGGGFLALDWRLLILSLLAAGATTGLMLVELAARRRGEKGGRGRGVLALLGKATAGALLVAAASGVAIVLAASAPFYLGPIEIVPAVGKLLASLFLSAGSLAAVVNARLMSRLIGFESRRAAAAPDKPRTEPKR